MLAQQQEEEEQRRLQQAQQQENEEGEQQEEDQPDQDDENPVMATSADVRSRASSRNEVSKEMRYSTFLVLNFIISYRTVSEFLLLRQPQ